MLETDLKSGIQREKESTVHQEQRTSDFVLVMAKEYGIDQTVFNSLHPLCKRVQDMQQHSPTNSTAQLPIFKSTYGLYPPVFKSVRSCNCNYTCDCSQKFSIEEKQKRRWQISDTAIITVLRKSSKETISLMYSYQTFHT